jgi:glycosyltransferase involved in cell wall biosynthesis
VKIVHLVIGGEVAGGQIVALRLARAARDAGHDVAFVSPTPGPFLDRVEGEGMRALVLPISGALDVGAVMRLRALLRGEQADLLHTHAHFSSNVVGRLAARLTGMPVISHMHIENAFRAGGAARTAQIVLDNTTAWLCAAIVAVSDATRESLLEQGYPAARTVTIHNGIEPAEPVEPAELDLPQGAPRLLEVARLCDVKGQRELIRALARLERQDAVVLLAGEDLEAGGAFRRGLEQEAEGLGVAERVRFLGYRGDVPALIAAADVFVLPSWVEGLPLGVLDAMARGKPVVAGAVGGTPELVADGETGLLVPPRDVDALVRALDELLRDADRARRLGEAGRERALAEFSAAAAAERVLRLYAAAT